MSPVATFTLEELRELITPALNVCWSLRLGIQNHPCRYQPAANLGAHGLGKLLHLAQERAAKNGKEPTDA